MLIPNNIGMDAGAPLARQMESYQAKFRRWWADRGPAEFLEQTMRLRQPTGETRGAGWAAYRSMRPADYTWGIFTVPTERTHIAFGEFARRDAWPSVPDEYRTLLLEHICVQADVENAAIEQSRTLTRSAPSGADLQNLFQFFLEEGRHTWAMVHLLLAHFGHEGEVQAEALLTRMSGDAEHPRLLDAFNYHTEDWLSHYMWCFLADRVGKYQIQAVTQSAFLPLAASARFMMFEEPLHITFGLAGLERVLYRSMEATLRLDSHDVFEAGAIPLSVFQKYFNFWVSKIFDLFGNDESARAHDLYRLGIRSPRGMEDGAEGEVALDVRVGDRIEQRAVAAQRATNAIMRRQYVAEVQRIVDRWNDVMRRAHVDFALRLPHERFGREFGPCKGMAFDIDGELFAGTAGSRGQARFPTADEVARVQGLMHRELDDGRVAAWIAPFGVRLDEFPGADAADRGQA